MLVNRQFPWEDGRVSGNSKETAGKTAHSVGYGQRQQDFAAETAGKTAEFGRIQPRQQDFAVKTLAAEAELPRDSRNSLEDWNCHQDHGNVSFYTRTPHSEGMDFLS